MSTDNRKTVGVEISDQLHEYLVLTAFYLNVSKSQVIRSALKKALFEEGLGKEDLMREINKDLQIAWDKLKHQFNEESTVDHFKKFKHTKEEELNKVGVPKKTIKQILSITK